MDKTVFVMHQPHALQHGEKAVFVKPSICIKHGQNCLFLLVKFQVLYKVALIFCVLRYMCQIICKLLSSFSLYMVQKSYYLKIALIFCLFISQGQITCMYS